MSCTAGRAVPLRGGGQARRIRGRAARAAGCAVLLLALAGCRGACAGAPARSEKAPHPIDPAMPEDVRLAQEAELRFGRAAGPADVRATLELVERALALNPASGRAWALKGWGLALLGRYQEVVDQLTPVARRGDLAPMDERRVKEWLGRALSALGREAEAEAVLKDAGAGIEDLKRRDPGFYYGCPFQALGQLYMGQARGGEAVEMFRKSADLEEEERSSQENAAVALLAAGRVEAAVLYAERLARLDARQVPLLNLALATLAARVRAGAPAVEEGNPFLVNGRGLLELTPEELAAVAPEGAPSPAGQRAGEKVGGLEARIRNTQPAPLVTAGAVLRARFLRPELTGDTRAALEGVEIDWPRAVGRAVENYLQGRYAEAQAYAVLARHAQEQPVLRVVEGFVQLTRNRLQDAEALFRAVGAETPEGPAAQAGLGHVALSRRDPAGAEPLLRAARERLAAGVPAGSAAELSRRFEWLGWRMACLGLGWLESNRNRNAEALPHYEAILSRDPDDTMALLGKGNSLTGLGRFEEARPLFQRILARDPQNAYALAEMGLLDYNSGRVEDAEKAFRAALANDSGHYTCPHEGLGLVYLRTGRIEEAKKSFEAAIGINPDIEYKKYNGLAKIYLREGNREKAAELLRKSIRNYPFDDEARQLLAGLEAQGAGGGPGAIPPSAPAGAPRPRARQAGAGAAPSAP